MILTVWRCLSLAFACDFRADNNDNNNNNNNNIEDKPIALPLAHARGVINHYGNHILHSCIVDEVHPCSRSQHQLSKRCQVHWSSINTTATITIE